MCIKTINIDTYPDGAQRVYETVETCRPGMSFLCPHPRIKEVRRLLPHKVHVVDVDRSSDFLRLPPTPRRSESGSPSGSEGRRRREREAGIYINGAKIADLGPREPVHRHSSPHRPRAVDIHQRPPPPFVPEAPSPRLHRSSTVVRPDYVVIEERQPRVGANVSRRRDIPPPPPPVTLTRRASMAAPTALPRRPVHPAPFIVVDDERRRRRLLERMPSVGVVPHHSAPTTAAATAGSTKPLVREAVHPSAAAAAASAAVRKELRWEDEQRAAQNARIAMRPKLHQEVRSILKKPPTAPAPPVVTSHSSDTERRMAALRRSFSGLEIGETTPEMARRLARAEAREEAEMKDRLRARFVRAGEPERRRESRVYYPGEGLYKYL